MPRKKTVETEVVWEETPDGVTLPEGWRWVKLGKFVKAIKGKKPKSLSKVLTATHSIPYVNIKAFESNTIDEYTDGDGAVLCNDGDFLMVWDGSRSGYVGRAIKGALGSTLVKLEFPEIHDEYAYYFLESKFIEINTRAKGVGIPHVDPNLLWNYDLLIPPLPTQQKIVAKIEALFTELDAGVEKLKAAQQQLKVYRQAVLKAAFEGELTTTQVANEKIKIPLGKLASSCLGKMLDKQKNKGRLMPYLRNINVRWGRFDLNNLEKMPFEEDEDERYLIRYGDLVVCEGGEPGRCAIWKDKVNTVRIQKALHRIRVSDLLNVDYLYYYFIFISMNGFIDIYFTGTTIKHLTGKELKNIPIPVYPINIQQSIVTAIETRLTACEAMEKEIEVQLSNAAQLRQSILKKAFSGELIS